MTIQLLFKPFAATAIFLLLVPGAALSQATSSKMDGIALSRDEPIHIESDKLEIHDKEHQANFDGNVVVIQGTTKLQANHMVVFYTSKDGKKSAISSAGSGDIDHIVVDGSVKLNSDKQTATGDHGTFDMTSQKLVLEGKKVVLTQDDNIFVGCRLTVTMDNGQAQLDSCGGRVQIQLDPKSRSK